MRKAPTQSKLNRSSGKLKRKARNLKASVETPKLTGEVLENLKKIQADIDTYNNDEIYILSEQFKSMQLHDETVVVRMYMENYIKVLDESNPEDIQVDAWHRQIDSRKKTSDIASFVSTPFPYLELGVITSISPQLILKYYKMKEELSKFNPELAETVYIPQVGDVIRVKARTSAWYKDHRFYLDKQAQCMDFVRDQVELRLNNFNHYFLMDAYDIESVVPTSPKKGYFISDNS